LQQKQVFFQAWTSKEAYLKAIGEGLAGGLDKIEIELNNINKKVIKIRGNQEIINNWYLEKININDDYIAAIALENFNGKISTWQS
jgi:4'-phosphopantetheinyl transferase